MSFKRTAISSDIWQIGYLSSQFNYNEQHNRVREPITRSRGLVRGQFPSKKMSRMIAWESQLERRACYLFEFSSAIKSFREQPITFTLKIGDKIKKYTPDFELMFTNNQTWYVEVKPFSKLSSLENQQHYQAVSSQLRKENYKFIILTEKELINPILEHNLLILRSYLNEEIPSETILDVKKRLQIEPNLTFAQLHQVFDITILLGLIAQAVISINFFKPISSNSVLMEANNENRLFSYRCYDDFR